MKAAAFALPIVLAFVTVVYVHFEQPIAIAYERSEQLYTEAKANQAIVEHAAALRRMQASARADLRTLSREASLSLSTANVITDLQATAAQFHIVVVGIEPATRPAVTPKTRNALMQTPLTIRVRGRFAGLLRFISNLSRRHTLVSVNDSSFALAQAGNRTQRIPLIEATVHATLYRLTPGQIALLQ